MGAYFKRRPRKGAWIFPNFDPSNLATILVFGAWLVLSVIRQLKEKPPGWLSYKLDVLYLIGSWRFFGPEPLTHDYHLFYRDTLENGGMTSWIRRNPGISEDALGLHLESRAAPAKMVHQCGGSPVRIEARR